MMTVLGPLIDSIGSHWQSGGRTGPDLVLPSGRYQMVRACSAARRDQDVAGNADRDGFPRNLLEIVSSARHRSKNAPRPGDLRTWFGAGASHPAPFHR
jgi:hypothetical protein